MKKNGNKSLNFKDNVYLYREDLIEIENIFKDVSGGEMKIKFDDFESPSISDIPENQVETTKICFEVYKPYISFNIGRYCSTFYLSEDKLELRGLVEKIQEILKRNSPSKIIFLRKILTYLEIIICSLILLVFISVIDSDQIGPLRDYLFISKSLATPLIVLFLLCFVSSMQLLLPAKSSINFCLRDAKLTFWKRNKDTIIVTLIVTILSPLILDIFHGFFN